MRLWRKYPTQEEAARRLQVIETAVLWYSEAIVHERHDAPNELTYYAHA